MESIHSIAAIERRAREEAARHSDINDACPYPWGTPAAEAFKKEFHAERARITSKKASTATTTESTPCP